MSRFDWVCAACGGDRFDVNEGEAYCVDCKTADGYCFACGAGRDSASIYPLELGEKKRVVCFQALCQETALASMREEIGEEQVAAMGDG